MFRRRKAVGTRLAVGAGGEARGEWGWTPSGVDLTRKDVVTIGDRTCQVREVVRWPSSLVPAWPADVLLVGDAAVVVRLVPEAPDAVRVAVGKSLPRLQSRLREGQKKGVPDAETERQVQDALALLDALASGQVRHYDTRVSTIYWSDSADACADAGRTAGRRARERGLEHAALSCSQGPSFKGAMPGGRPVMRGLLLDQQHVSACFPFVSEDMLDEGGVLVGLNERTGGPVLWSRWEPDVSHMVVCADTGYGKSYAVKMLASQEFVLGRPVLVLDPSPKREYRAFTQTMGGAYIDLHPAGVQRLNPLEIAADGQAAARGQRPEQASGRPISERIAAVKPVMAALCGESLETGTYDATLEEALQTVYRTAGLSDSWGGCFEADTDALGSITWQPRGTWPTLSAIRDALDALEDADGQRYARMLRPYCAGGSADLLDGQTTVELHARCVGIGVNELIGVGGRFARAGYAAVVDYAAQRLRALPEPRKCVVVDEAHNFLADPQMARWLERQMREARKQGISMTVISQGVSDFTHDKAGRAVWQNAAARLYLHQPAGDLAEAAVYLGLDPQTLLAAAHLPRGHAILQVADRVVQVSIQAPRALDPILRSDVAFEEQQQGGGGGVAAG